MGGGDPAARGSATRSLGGGAADGAARPSGALFALRRALGRLLGLDRGRTGFVPVYQEPDEALSRIANRTVTAFLHVSLVERHPRLAIYVRPKGALGRSYMAVIEPFRRWVIYPALLAAGSRAAKRLGG